MHSFHKSILVSEILNILAPKKDGELLIDGTLGEGGHAEAFLNAYPCIKIIGLDADEEIQSIAKARLSSFNSRISYVLGFSDEFFENYPSSLPRPDLILLDLGVSMYHYTTSKKGFSFNASDDIDMRLSPSLQTKASDIVLSFSEKQIATILREYGEECYALPIAHSIVNYRKTKKIETSKELASIVYNAVPPKYRHRMTHPATKTFQALRIAVNKELWRLPRILNFGFTSLCVGGKMGVITFHSLEDRIVKLYFRKLATSCICPPDFPICKCGKKPYANILTRKAIRPSKGELERNGAARSAKFRAIEKIREPETK